MNWLMPVLALEAVYLITCRQSRDPFTTHTWSRQQPNFSTIIFLAPCADAQGFSSLNWGQGTCYWHDAKSRPSARMRREVYCSWFEWLSTANLSLQAADTSGFRYLNWKPKHDTFIQLDGRTYWLYAEEFQLTYISVSLFVRLRLFGFTYWCTWVSPKCGARSNGK